MRKVAYTYTSIKKINNLLGEIGMAVQRSIQTRVSRGAA